MRVYAIDHVQLAMPVGEEEKAIATDELLAGYHRVYLNDPFGNRIELMEVVKSVSNER